MTAMQPTRRACISSDSTIDKRGRGVIVVNSPAAIGAGIIADDAIDDQR